jgi:hypothetical protein
VLYRDVVSVLNLAQSLWIFARMRTLPSSRAAYVVAAYSVEEPGEELRVARGEAKVARMSES